MYDKTFVLTTSQRYAVRLTATPTPAHRNAETEEWCYVTMRLVDNTVDQSDTEREISIMVSGKVVSSWPLSCVALLLFNKITTHRLWSLDASAWRHEIEDSLWHVLSDWSERHVPVGTLVAATLGGKKDGNGHCDDTRPGDDRAQHGAQSDPRVHSPPISRKG